MSLGPIFDLFPVWNSRRRRRVVKSKSTKRALRWRRMSDWDILIVYLKIVKNQTRKLCVVFFFRRSFEMPVRGGEWASRQAQHFSMIYFQISFIHRQTMVDQIFLQDLLFHSERLRRWWFLCKCFTSTLRLRGEFMDSVRLLSPLFSPL